MSEPTTTTPDDASQQSSSAANDAALDSETRPNSDDPSTAEGNRYSPDFKSEPEVPPSTQPDDEKTDADIDTTGG